jgi:hypothetical protein
MSLGAEVARMVVHVSELRAVHAVAFPMHGQARAL